MQKEDLARMYRLFSRIPKGLDPVADAFKKHVESEGLRLVKEVAEAAIQKKEAGRVASLNLSTFTDFAGKAIFLLRLKAVQLPVTYIIGQRSSKL